MRRALIRYPGALRIAVCGDLAAGSTGRHRASFPPVLGRARLLHTATQCWKAQGDKSRDQPPTDLNELNVLGNTPAPSTSVDVCLFDGFGLNSGITISGGDGALLVSGEAFAWRPWETRGNMELVNGKGQFELPAEAFGLFDLLWPRPGMSPAKVSGILARIPTLLCLMFILQTCWSLAWASTTCPWARRRDDGLRTLVSEWRYWTQEMRRRSSTYWLRSEGSRKSPLP